MSFNKTIHLGALTFKPAAHNLSNIILSWSMWFLKKSLLKTSISLIYVLTPSMSPGSSSTLDWIIYPKAHMPIGRLLYLNFTNSVTIVLVSLLAGEILIGYYPMIISNADAYCNNSSCYIVSPILGNGYAFLANFWLSM